MKPFSYIVLWLVIIFLLLLIPRYNFALGEESAFMAEFALYTPVLTPNNAIISPKLEPRAIIIQKAKHYGVDVDLALDLAEYESNTCTNNHNPKSSAKGCFQFIDSTWETYCTGFVLNPMHNADCAMRLISEGQIRHWLADKAVANFLISKGYVN